MLRSFLLVASLVAAVPGADAHRSDCQASAGGSLCHLTLNVQDLAPGDEHTYALHSERIAGDFPAGWVVTAFAGIQGAGQVTANLTLGNETRHSWEWNGNRFHSNSTRIGETGHYALHLQNPGTESVRYAFYYDQSCNCASKVIPINGGFVLFNYDLPAGRNVRLGFPTLEGWELKGQLALLKNDGGRWPVDFQILSTVQQTGKGWLQFDFQTETEATYYVFIEAPKGVGRAPDGTPLPVELTPLLEVEEAQAPAIQAFAVVLGVAVVVAFTRRKDPSG